MDVTSLSSSLFIPSGQHQVQWFVCFWPLPAFSQRHALPRSAMNRPTYGRAFCLVVTMLGCNAVFSLSICVHAGEHDKHSIIDLLLQPRSLYIMTGEVRYEYSHAILSKEESLFQGLDVPRGRRLSLIFRDALPGDQALMKGSSMKYGS